MPTRIGLSVGRNRLRFGEVLRFGIGLCAVLILSGFINIEDVRRQSGPGFTGRTRLGFSGQRGNTDKFATNPSTLNIYSQDRHEFLVLGDYTFSRTEGNTDTNNGRLHLRYTFDPKERLAYETFAQTEFDQFRELRSRDLVGENLRQRLMARDKNFLYLGYGVFYENQDWTKGPDWEGLRGNLYLSYVNVFSATASAFATFYYQPAWNRLNDYHLQSEVGLNSALSDRLLLDLQVSLDSETRHPVGVKPTDIVYQGGINLKY